MIKYIFLFIEIVLVPFLFVSCFLTGSNEICFNEKELAIETCDKRSIIRRLEIKSENSFYSIKKSGNGSCRFYLFKDNIDYEIFGYRTSELKILPYVKYTVYHKNKGDQRPGILEFELDSNYHLLHIKEDRFNGP